MVHGNVSESKAISSQKKCIVLRKLIFFCKFRGVARALFALFCIRQLGLPYDKAKILTKIRQLKKRKERKTKLTFWDYYLSFYTREADKINPYSQIHHFLLHLISVFLSRW